MLVARHTDPGSIALFGNASATWSSAATCCRTRPSWRARSASRAWSASRARWTGSSLARRSRSTARRTREESNGYSEIAERRASRAFATPSCGRTPTSWRRRSATKPGATLVSICSAGDNALAMLTLDPARVVVVDLSPAQIACLKIRIAAYRALDACGVPRTDGVAPRERRGTLLDQVLRGTARVAGRSGGPCATRSSPMASAASASSSATSASFSAICCRWCIAARRSRNLSRAKPLRTRGPSSTPLERLALAARCCKSSSRASPWAGSAAIPLSSTMSRAASPTMWRAASATPPSISIRPKTPICTGSSPARMAQRCRCLARGALRHHPRPPRPPRYPPRRARGLRVDRREGRWLQPLGHLRIHDAGGLRGGLWRVLAAANPGAAWSTGT